jgi:hypothetical protein
MSKECLSKGILPLLSPKVNEIFSIGFQNFKKDKSNLSGNPSVNFRTEEGIFPSSRAEELTDTFLSK